MTTETREIRGAGQGDSAAIAALLEQLGYPATSADVAERLKYWFREPRSQVLTVCGGGQILGFVGVHAIPHLERTGWWGRITALVVAEHARHSGVGRMLVGAAETAARDWGCLSMEVTSSSARNQAHGFYRGLGYEDQCIRSGRFAKPL